MEVIVKVSKQQPLQLPLKRIGVINVLAKRINVEMRSARPFPISYIILAAQQCSCDVYIWDTDVRINAKDYNQMKRSWHPQGNRVVFYLNGADEAAEGDKLQKALERQI